MPADRGRQKSLAKHKKKRELAQKKEQQRRLAAPSMTETLIRKALSHPRGDTYISSNWSNTAEPAPPLVSVVLTWQMGDGTVIPCVALVDRTCLGIKNAFVGRPLDRGEMDGFLARMSESHGGMEVCDLLLAQSIVYHALDYSRSLGFLPNADFSEPLFGPRPERLLATPYARPERPIYVPGPDDDGDRIIAQLERIAAKGSPMIRGGKAPASDASG